jgi:putative protease
LTNITLLQENPRLIPWFPAVLIGKDYLESVKILEQVKPKRIVTNNTGIAYKAYEMGIEWIAGPFLNTTNSHALLTLKEELNCAGAFISNEINRGQIRNITRPENFKLCYSIYGGYPSIYNHEQFLNFDAVNDFSHLFDEFFIDLTNIGAGSKQEQDKVELIKHFEALLAGNDDAKAELDNLVPISTNAQYVQGL